jgi:transcriptional regulator with XRE-family HTH domain
MDVNQRIKHLMDERGWTPYRLAKESNLSDATVGNLFRRNTVPSTPTLEAICNGLGITLSQFFAEGDMVEVTPELKELFDDWAVLSTDQKEILRQIIKGMKKAQ